MSNLRVLVTGYGGFLGSAICRKLIDRGDCVTGIARKTYPELQHIGVKALSGDLCDAAACDLACRDIDAVVHTAALAGVWGNAAEFYRANVIATKNLIAACQRNAIQNFVYCSSPSVTFDGKDQSGIDETAPYPTKWLCEYPRTKAIAERSVLEAHRPESFRTIALRPHLIWGLHDPHLIPRVIAKCRQGRLLRIGDGKNLIDIVHVDNAARAHLLALDKTVAKDKEALGRSYFITDGDPIGCWDWLSKLVSLAGLPVPERHLSLSAAYAIGATLEAAYKLLGVQREPPLTRFITLQLGRDHYFSIDAARRNLGYMPIVDRATMLESMKPWILSL